MAQSKGVVANLTKAFNTGVSYMMPVVVVGGIFLALSLAGGDATEGKGMVVTNPFLQNIGLIGTAGFTMMIPVLAGYISYSLAGKPGIAPAMITGYMANTPIGDNHVQTGFLGAMLMGVLCGYIARWVKKWNVGDTLKVIMPILIVPIVTSFIAAMLYIYILVEPIGWIMSGLIVMLSGLKGGSALILGLIIGAMAAFDMGGPVNKTATAFTLALMAEGIYEPNGAYRIAVAIPPLGIGISTFLFRNRWDDVDRQMGISAIFMGCIGITEGAIPFAVKGLKTVIPSVMIGSAVGAGLGMVQGVQCLVPHGGFIVLPAVTVGAAWYALDIVIGSLITAVCLYIMRPNINKENAQA